MAKGQIVLGSRRGKTRKSMSGSDLLAAAEEFQRTGNKKMAARMYKQAITRNPLITQIVANKSSMPIPPSVKVKSDNITGKFTLRGRNYRMRYQPIKPKDAAGLLEIDNNMNATEALRSSNSAAQRRNNIIDSMSEDDCKELAQKFGFVKL